MKEVKIKVPTADDFVSDEFVEHVVNAYKEFLLALRCVIDEQIKKAEERAKGGKELKKIEISD